MLMGQVLSLSVQCSVERRIFSCVTPHISVTAISEYVWCFRKVLHHYLTIFKKVKIVTLGGLFPETS